MPDIGYASMPVVPSFKGLKGDLERGTGRALTQAGISGGTRFGDSAGRSAGQRFGSVFKTAAKASLIGFLGVAAGTIKIGADSLGEAREAQKVQRQTNAVIKSTGGAAKTSARDVGRLATNLSKMAGIDDEVIQGGENVLLTFKNIRNEQGKGNKVFNKATKATLDMSVALKKDLSSSALQVGRALNDPVAGMTALSRAGVQFTDDQKEQIKTLVESGDKLGAQKIILRELSDEFSGAAKSQASSSDRLKVAFGNVEEKLGKGLLPLVQDFSRFLLRKGIPAAEDFADWFTKKGVPAIEDFVDEARPFVQKWLPKIGDGLQNAAGFGKDVAKFLGKTADAFDELPPWVKQIVAGSVGAGFVAKKLNLSKLITGGDGIFSKGGSPARPLYVWQVNAGTGAGAPGGSKVTPIVKAAGTASLIGVIAGGITLGVGKLIGKKTRESLAASGGQGVGLNADSNFFDLSDENAAKHRLERQKEFVARLGQEWLSTKDKANDYNLFVRHGLPGELKFTVLGWPVAQKQARDYLATLLEIRDLHMDVRLDRAGGSGTTAGSGIAPNLDPTPHGGKRGHTIVPRTTVFNTTNNNYVADMRESERRRLTQQQQQSLGGFGGPT